MSTLSRRGGGGAPVSQASDRPTKITRTSGNFTLGTNWADLPGQEIVIAGAVVGDEHEIGVSGNCGSEANHGNLDAVTYVSSVIQHWLSGATSEDSVNGNGGVSGWFMPGAAFFPIGGSLFYTVQAADIDADGHVTWRLRGKGNAKTLFAVPTHPFQWWVRRVA